MDCWDPGSDSSPPRRSNSAARYFPFGFWLLFCAPNPPCEPNPPCDPKLLPVELKFPPPEPLLNALPEFP